MSRLKSSEETIRTKRDTAVSGVIGEADASSRRIGVTFSKEIYQTLEELAIRKNKSMADVLREAITLEKWIQDALDQDFHVLLERKGKVRELLLR